MRNVIIVEGKTDKEFISQLIDSAQVLTFQIEMLGGQERFAESLETIARRVIKQEIDKVGIVIDLDDFTVAARLQWVNRYLVEVFDCEITVVDTLINVQYEGVNFQLACHFIQPNLDVLLRAIAAKPSPRADCLHACLESQENAKQKEREKAWPLYYMRWDICDFAERGNGSKNVTFSHTNTKGAWNLASPVLGELKAFLSLF
jgi:5S rRNA maturation endonuclease (ribonuclease M5)